VVQVGATPAQVIAFPQPTQQKAETSPFIMVFVAMMISFFLSTAAVGAVAAWIYLLRHSGAFAP
jgi:hypothetical protein